MVYGIHFYLIPCFTLIYKCKFARMYHVRLLILLISLTSFLFMVLGLIKPWIMLWWEDVQNRRKVIKLYGTTGLSFLIIYWVLQYV
jgi:hypothetical protein